MEPPPPWKKNLWDPRLKPLGFAFTYQILKSFIHIPKRIFNIINYVRVACSKLICVAYLCDIRSEVCFYLHIWNKCMNFMMYQKSNAVAYIFGNGGGLVIGMSRVRIPLPANQERAYLV